MKSKCNLVEAHIVRNRNEIIEYLMLKRASNQKYPNIWQMVTGKIKENEKAYNAAQREIKEETGLEIDKLFVVPNVNSFYNDEDDTVNYVPVFVAVVENGDNIKLSEEHTGFKWVNKKETKGLLAWPGQYKSVKLINDYFTNKNKSLNFIEINL